MRTVPVGATGPTPRGVPADDVHDVWHRIDGTRCRTKSDLLGELAHALAFPDWFGRNWDALFDCLLGLDRLGPERRGTPRAGLPRSGRRVGTGRHVLVFTAPEDLLVDAEPELGTFLQVLTDARLYGIDAAVVTDAPEEWRERARRAMSARRDRLGDMDRLMLLDTASLYFRAFYGVPDSMTAPDGTPVNAVRGLLDFITRLVDSYRPTHLVCCWDNDWRPQWRVDLIPSYKAHRVEEVVPGGSDVEEVPDPLQVQIPIIVATLEAIGIRIVGADGYEADDVIGTLATDAGMPVDVVTGDRDLFQLVDDGAAGGPVRVLYTARGVGRHEVLTDAVVVEKYGVRPDQYADFATMRGDSSDGLPGVAGVGEKTAASLLASFGDLAGIRAAAADPGTPLAAGVRAKIKAAADYLDVAPEVVAVARRINLGEVDAALPGSGPGYPVPRDPAALTELVDRWGLGGSVSRLLDVLTPATS
ncbi:barstar family protein [Ruania sp. N2-46]|uniref:5'-3' exonuclease n=2 Tax=Occultella gossypii TaxID=2800820 RepID=A0ABS7S2N4_9MICO|nr:barstar family protein [Occultella gossypii]